MTNPEEIKNELDNFTGTERYYRTAPWYLLTDGAKYLGERCHAFWLMDVIASYLPQLTDEPFLVAKLKLRDDGGADFTLTDDDPPINVNISQLIGFTDFPLDSITLYAQFDGSSWVIMLPSEY